MSIIATVGSAAGAALLQKVITELMNKDWGKIYKESTSSSMVEYSSLARNDFLTVIEEDLLALPYMGAVQQSVLSLVSGYFLSSVSLLVDIPGVDVRETLGKLNTRRDPIESVLGKGSEVLKFVGTESFEHGLPSPVLGLETQIYQGIACEDLKDELDLARLDNENLKYEQVKAKMGQDAEGHKDKTINDRIRRRQMQEELKNQKHKDKNTQLQNKRIEKDLQGTGSVGFGKGTLDVLKETTNLSIGKVLDVTFERDGNRKIVPVTISLATTSTDSSSMRNILTFQQGQNFKHRYYRAKAGELKYVRDLIMCNDLRDEARKSRHRDKSGFLDHMMRRQVNNNRAGLLGMSPSLNNASAVLMFSTNTARDIELDIGGPLSDFKIRKRVFDKVSAMLLVVVDPRWERVRFYHRGIELHTDVSVNELKRAANGKGSNVEDILMAYSSGAAPMS